MTSSDMYCPLWRRLCALVYDLLAVIAMVMVVGYVCQRITGGQLISTAGHAQIAWWYQPLQAVVVSAYFVISWLRGGQTLGMRPWRIRLRNAQGLGVSFAQALLRLLVAGAPLLLLALAPWLGIKTTLWAIAVTWIVWFGVAVFDPHRRALHDVVARTVLYR